MSKRNRSDTTRRPARSGTAKRAVILAAVIIVLLLVLPAAALAQDEPEPRCHPLAGWLASQIGDPWDCQALMDLHAEGNGYGNLAKAWYLSHYVEPVEGDWTGLIGAPKEENAWGELAHAVRLAAELSDTSAGRLLELRHGWEEELGWGRLRQAAALAADRGLSFDDALAQLATEEGWRADDDEPGPPPWANNKPKDKPPKPPKPPKPDQSGDD